MRQRSWLNYLGFLGMLLVSTSAWANPQMQKGIKHFKDFEIRQGLKIFLQLENDGSMSNAQKAQAAMYAGMSYAYLRKKQKAVEHFRKAIQLDSSIQLPKGTPGRLRKLFKQAKASAGSAPPTPRSSGGSDPFGSLGGGTRTTPPRPAPVQPRSDTFDPPPVRRTTSPPPRRRFSFGGFDMGKTPRRRPAPRREAFFPTPRRRASSSMIDERPRPVRRRYQPAPTPRRVAMANPGGGDTMTPGLTGTSQAKSRGGNGLLIAGGVTVGVAAVLAGVGVAMGAVASGQAGLAKDPNTYQMDIPVIQSDANSSAMIANIMYIGAGVAAIAGISMIIVHAMRPKPKPKTEALPPISMRRSLPPPSKVAPPPAQAKTLSVVTSP
ncbi:MAG: hypothetical protein EP343_22000 [Deltaproteobacteria bacterium]|nr:MAG: hypothetical protein EP343_22000 [Deltaproteobacteria bacterium]